MPTTFSSNAVLFEYAKAAAMADALADRITDGLSRATTRREEASFAVSGGSTPRALYERLAQRSPEWSRIAIVLVDERWVELGTRGSNEMFLRESLVRSKAAAARFVGLKTVGQTACEGLAEAEPRLSEVSRPFDSVVLGMGEDGHTASWFPHAQALEAAIGPSGSMVAAVDTTETNVTGPFTQRITLTRLALSRAIEIHLLLCGADKRRAWQETLGSGPVADMPVRALLRDPDIQLHAHWAS